MDDFSSQGCLRCIELEKRLAEQAAAFEKRIADLMARLEAVERSAKRQAAPFSKGPPKKKPSRPANRTRGAGSAGSAAEAWRAGRMPVRGAVRDEQDHESFESASFDADDVAFLADLAA